MKKTLYKQYCEWLEQEGVEEIDAYFVHGNSKKLLPWLGKFLKSKRINISPASALYICCLEDRLQTAFDRLDSLYRTPKDNRGWFKRFFCIGDRT